MMEQAIKQWIPKLWARGEVGRSHKAWRYRPGNRTAAYKPRTKSGLIVDKPEQRTAPGCSNKATSLSRSE